MCEGKMKWVQDVDPKEMDQQRLKHMGRTWKTLKGLKSKAASDSAVSKEIKENSLGSSNTPVQNAESSSSSPPGAQHVGHAGDRHSREGVQGDQEQGEQGEAGDEVEDFALSSGECHSTFAPISPDLGEIGAKVKSTQFARKRSAIFFHLPVDSPEAVTKYARLVWHSVQSTANRWMTAPQTVSRNKRIEPMKPGRHRPRLPQEEPDNEDPSAPRPHPREAHRRGAVRYAWSGR